MVRKAASLVLGVFEIICVWCHWQSVADPVCMLSWLQRQEREMQQVLEEKEENTLNMQETFSSLQQEVEIKTKKLKKVRSLCDSHLRGRG